jgi:hypothetical protein
MLLQGLKLRIYVVLTAIYESIRDWAKLSSTLKLHEHARTHTHTQLRYLHGTVFGPFLQYSKKKLTIAEVHCIVPPSFLIHPWKVQSHDDTFLRHTNCSIRMAPPPVMKCIPWHPSNASHSLPLTFRDTVCNFIGRAFTQSLHLIPLKLMLALGFPRQQIIVLLSFGSLIFLTPHFNCKLYICSYIQQIDVRFGCYDLRRRTH